MHARTHTCTCICKGTCPPPTQAEKEILSKGEELPEISFDSNCITPGTVFMDELGRHLRFFIRKKISEDPLWQKPFIVFSGGGACTQVGGAF